MVKTKACELGLDFDFDFDFGLSLYKVTSFVSSLAEYYNH